MDFSSAMERGGEIDNKEQINNKQITNLYFHQCHHDVSPFRFNLQKSNFTLPEKTESVYITIDITLKSLEVYIFELRPRHLWVHHFLFEIFSLPFPSLHRKCHQWVRDIIPCLLTFLAQV